MKLLFGIVLTLLSLATAEVDWSKVFPSHLYSPGIRPPHGIPNPRITGGEEAKPHSLPYQVAVLTPLAEGTAFCGGSLITDQWVITAAHCVDHFTGPLTVILGAHRINEEETTQVRMRTSHVIIHPDWSSLLLRNDIALIKLPESVQQNENIKPIGVADDPSNSFEGHTAVVSGWGLESDESDTISDVLRKVDVPVINNETCNIAYFGTIKDSHICTSGLGGKSTCSGDSGGPLVVGGRLIGVVSFGISLGCEVGFPAVYTRVTSFLEFLNTWID